MAITWTVRAECGGLRDRGWSVGPDVGDRHMCTSVEGPWMVTQRRWGLLEKVLKMSLYSL